MNYITKFEKVYLIGARATQLSEGAPPKIEIKDMDDPIQIASEEFRQRKTCGFPLLLERTMPDGKKITLCINDLECPRE